MAEKQGKSGLGRKGGKGGKGGRGRGNREGKTLCFENPGFNSLSDFSLCEIEGEARWGKRGNEPLAAEGGQKKSTMHQN